MTVVMFPGQGSQARGMGKALFDRFADMTRLADDVLGYSIKDLCVDDPRKELGDTRFTQPALYVVNALSYRAHSEDGADRPAALIGHSLGEYNALQAAGVFTFETGLRLVHKRGALMGGAPPGAMAAIIGPTVDVIRSRLRDHHLEAIDIANLNTPTQTILSGLKDDIARALPLFDGAGSRAVALNTSGAFHSRYMRDAQQAFAGFLKDFGFSTPTIPVVANVTARRYDADNVAETLIQQISSPVNWVGCVQSLLAMGESEFLELGPGRVLARLVADIRKHPLPAANDAAPQAAGPGATDKGTRRQRDHGALQGRINEWNHRFPVGTRVTVPRYPGIHVTRTPAMALFGHRAAIYLEGYNGYFDLNEVRPAG